MPSVSEVIVKSMMIMFMLIILVLVCLVAIGVVGGLIYVLRSVS